MMVRFTSTVMIYQLINPFSCLSKPFILRATFRGSLPLIVFIISTLGVLGFSTFQTLGDPDTFLHLTIGQWMISHHAVPIVDYFSHSLPGTHWVAHEWLSELILAMVYQMGGWGGLVLLVASCLGLSLALLAAFLQKRMPPIYALLFTALAFFALATHLLVRPHVLVWPLLLIWVGTLLDSAEHHLKPPYLLLLVMALWVNLHGSFIFGLAIIFPIALQALQNAPSQFRKVLMGQWLIFIGLAFATCLLNPQGLAGAIFPLQILNLEHLATIVEWMPYRFSGFNPLEILLFLYLALALLGLLRMPIITIVMLLGLLHMALTHNRYVSIFGLLSPMLIASAFGLAYAQKMLDQIPSKIDLFFSRLTLPAGSFAIMIAVGLTMMLAFIGNHMGRYHPPENILATSAINAFERSGRAGPVLNDYQFGGALIYRGIPVLIDGRADLYDQALMGNYVAGMIEGKPSALQNLIDQYQITWALLVPDSPAIAYFDRQKGWQRLYADGNAVIYFKNSPVN